MIAIIDHLCGVRLTAFDIVALAVRRVTPPVQMRISSTYGGGAW
jgi:hypothetical protein